MALLMLSAFSVFLCWSGSWLFAAFISSVAWLKKTAAAGLPFFAFVGTTGPHLPATPAPWHMQQAAEWAAENFTAPRTPNFNTLASDHFDLLSTHKPLAANEIWGIDKLMQSRW